MFSFTARSTRRVRIISAAVAVGAMVAAFGMTAASASAVSVGPVNTVAPAIDGVAVENNTLTADSGVWIDGSDTDALTYTFAWYDNAGNFLGDGNSYTLTAADVGATIHATVSASDTNNDGDSADSVDTATVVASDLSNATLPVLSGSATPGSTLSVTPGTWTTPGLYGVTYEWFETSLQNGGPLDPADITDSHVITSDDFGLYIGVLVTATDSIGASQTVRVTTATPVTPTAPFATDAGLTAANEGGVTGTQSKTDATAILPAPAAEGDLVFVYGYSTPTALGFFTVSAAHTITVPLGALPKGLHKLAVINSSGVLIGWLSVTAGGGLASTGVPVNVPLELGGAGLLVLLGLFSVIYVTRRSRTNANA